MRINEYQEAGEYCMDHPTIPMHAGILCEEV
jgi:hypothetical protein